MSILVITVPVTLLVAASLLWLVVRAVREGAFDDWEGPAARHLLDDDHTPERDAGDGADQAPAPAPGAPPPGREPSDVSASGM